MKRNQGFTLIEMGVVVLIVGLLSNLLFPYIRHVRIGADASSVMSELNAIRLAGFDHYVATGEFPPTAALGEVPPQMVSRLPEDFDFHYGDATYMWISVQLDGQRVVGPLLLGPEELVAHAARMASTAKIQGPTFVFFMYED